MLNNVFKVYMAVCKYGTDGFQSSPEGQGDEDKVPVAAARGFWTKNLTVESQYPFNHSGGFRGGGGTTEAPP